MFPLVGIIRNVQEDGVNTVLDEMDQLMEEILNTYQGMEEIATEMPGEEEGTLDPFVLLLILIIERNRN